MANFCNKKRPQNKRAKFLNLWSKNDFDNLTHLYEVNRYLFYNIQRDKEGKRYLWQRILNYGVRGCTLYKQRGHPTILVKLQPFFNLAKCNLGLY